MTLEERVAELEAENAVLREQIREVPLLRVLQASDREVLEALVGELGLNL